MIIFDKIISFLNKISPKDNKIKPKEEKKDTFCILPWIHVDCLADSAVARICCSSYPIEQDHVPLSYYHHSVDDICNSPYMKEVRKKMIKGEGVAACNICYVNELNQVNNRRLMQNEKWKRYPGLDFEKIINETIANDYKIDVKPYFIQLNLGNLCNLKCRMCHAGNSTVINKDPIQSLWSPPRYPHKRLFWQENKISLLPNPFISCVYEGFPDLVFNNKNGFVSITEVGKIKLPVFEDTPLDKMVLSLFAPKDINKISIACNGKILDEVSLAAQEKKTFVFDFDGFTGAGEIEIIIALPKTEDNRALQVQQLDLLRKDDNRSPDESEIVYCRTGSKKPWYIQEEMIFGDFLNDLSNLKEILFTGGEPLINPVMEKIIDVILAEGREKDITLALNTNTTYLPEGIMQKLLKFDTMHLNLSIDAVGDVYEYIRYPAKWEKVKNNIYSLKEKNISLVAVPILQAYNVLYIADLCRFFEETGVNYSLIMMHGPYFLHCALLPDPIRKLAADRLRDFANKEAPHEKKNNLLNIAQSIESITIKVDKHKALEDFMMFTNDTDTVNSQNIRESIPELVELLQENGFDWCSKTRYAKQR